MEAKQKLETLLDELGKANRLPRLSAAAHDVDAIIDLLSAAREQIAGGELLLAGSNLNSARSLTLPQQWTPTRRASR